MGGFIILEDGRAWAYSNGAYAMVIEEIAAQLPDTPEGQALSNWLLEETNVGSMGLGCVDIRELTEGNRKLFKQAAQRAYTLWRIDPNPHLQDELGTDSDVFYALLKLMKSVNKREDPKTYMQRMKSLIEPTGEKSGLGWD